VYPRNGGVEVYFRDITDRKVFEERFRRLFDSNIVGMACADEERIYEANDLLLEMLGYTREEFRNRGLNWRELTPPEHLANDEAALRDLTAAGSFRPFEKEYLRKDGSRASVLLGGTILQQSPMQSLCFILDLSERKRLERQVLEAQKLESLGMLAGGIAHDFNNLLVGVMGNASLAQEMLPPEHPVTEMLERIVSASEHAGLLTKQMLAYSGKGRFVIELVNLTELIREILAIVHPAIPKKIAVRMALDGSTPAVEADRSQMQQILTNLVLNAAEAIGQSAGVVVVTTGARALSAADMRRELNSPELEPGLYVYLRVDDTGCGMDEETKGRIFDPFFTTKFTGRGLGLAAVAGIVRGHKGAIRVSTAPGQGSSFTVFLPAAEQPPVPLEARASADELCGEGTILVVDDEPVVRDMGKRTLERYGYRVVLAESGPEAIQKFREQAGAVAGVLLDLSMPGMGGVETLRELRKIEPGARVLLSSGYNEVETMRLFDGLDVAGFIQKPYTTKQLANKVKKALSTPGRSDLGHE